MLEVNRELVLQAARAARDEGNPSPVVITAATWGRGNLHARLARLKESQRYAGYNSSVIAVPPVEVAELFCNLQDAPRGTEPGFLAIGVAFGKSYAEWWNFDGSETTPELF